MRGVLHGQLDAVTTSGYVEGWAFDGDNLLQPLMVRVIANETVVATGLASRYRWDLAGSGCGTGWCAFRLRLDAPIIPPDGATWSLIAIDSRAELFQTLELRGSDETEATLSVLADIRLADPTVVHAIDQLAGCAKIFAAFIDQHGVERFVAQSYVYVLGRSADRVGAAFYAAALRAQSISPLNVLARLYDSEEFRSGPQLLVAPPEPGFAFRLA